MFDGIIGAIKEGCAKADAERDAQRAAQREAEKRQALEAEQRAQRQAQINALTGGGLGCERGSVNHVMGATLGSSNLDGIFNDFAPHLTHAIYSMYSKLYSQAQEAAVWKAKCEELEKRCAEQSKVIETFTKERSKSNSFSR